MNIYYILLTGMGIVILSLVLYRISRKRNKEQLPPQLMNDLLRIWEKHPNLLMNLGFILENWNEIMQQKMKEEEERNERVESNKNFESILLQTRSMPEMTRISVEGFSIKLILEQHYLGERSLFMEKCLQQVCDKIADMLEPEELDIILQIDRKLCIKALDMLLEHDMDVVSGMDEIDRMLHGNKPGPDMAENNSDNEKGNQ